MSTQSAELDAAILTFATLIQLHAERQAQLEGAALVVAEAAEHLAQRMPATRAGMRFDAQERAHKVAHACRLVKGSETLMAAAHALRDATGHGAIECNMQEGSEGDLPTDHFLHALKN